MCISFKQGHCPTQPKQSNQNQEINIDTLLPSNPQSTFKFCNCPINVCYSKTHYFESHVLFRNYVFLVSFHLKQWLSFSLTVMTLTLLKITGSLSCRMSVSLSLFDVSLWLDSVYIYIWQEHHRTYLMFFFFSHWIIISIFKLSNIWPVGAPSGCFLCPFGIFLSLFEQLLYIVVKQ